MFSKQNHSAIHKAFSDWFCRYCGSLPAKCQDERLLKSKGENFK
jgi:hypothetical protein